MMTAADAKSALARLVHWHEGRAGLRMVIAALIAYALAHAIKPPGAYSGVLTTIIVARSDAGGTLQASLDRLLATLLGAGLACLVSFGRVLAVPEMVLIAMALTPLAIVVAHNAAYRTSMMAAMIVLSAAGMGGSPIHVALLRTAEVGMGAVVGAAVSVTVVPSRLDQVVRRGVADLLPDLGRLARAIAEPEALDERRRDQLEARARQALRVLGARTRKRKPKDGPNVPGMMVRGVSRLNADLAFLQRELERGDASPSQLAAVQRLLESFHHWADAAATAIRRGRPAPSPAMVLEAARACRHDPDGAPVAPGLGFLTEAFAADLGGLARGLAAAQRTAAPRRKEMA